MHIRTMLYSSNLSEDAYLVHKKTELVLILYFPAVNEKGVFRSIIVS